jgi:hypothetical protein
MYPSCAQSRGDEPQAARRSKLRRLPAAEQRDDSIEVVDVEVAAHVRTAEPQLTAYSDDVSDGPRRVNGHGRPMARRRDARAIPELDGEGAIWQGPLDAAPQPVGA